MGPGRGGASVERRGPAGGGIPGPKKRKVGSLNTWEA